MQLAQRIREHFAELDKAPSEDGRLGRPTGVGYYYPGGVAQIEQGISLALQEGLISSDGWYLDAGSGDARGVIVPAGIFGIPSLGIEFDPEVSRLAERNIARFEGELPAQARVTRGDFTDPRSYDDLGVGFSELSTVFNYFNGHDDVASMIEMFSPPGTTFLLLSIIPRLLEFDGLEHEESFAVFDDSRVEPRMFRKPNGEVYYADQSERAFLHVYKKT